MKKLLLLTPICLLTVFGCKKDGDKASIVGKWRADKLVTTINLPGQATKRDTLNYAGTSTSVEFTADGKASVIFNGNTTSYQYSLSGTTLTLKGTNNYTETDNVSTVTKTTLVIHNETPYISNNVTGVEAQDSYYTRIQ